MRNCFVYLFITLCSVSAFCQEQAWIKDVGGLYSKLSPDGSIVLVDSHRDIDFNLFIDVKKLRGTSELLWITSFLDPTNNGVSGFSVSTEGDIYVSTYASLRKLDSDGLEQWNTSHEMYEVSELTCTAQFVYVAGVQFSSPGVGRYSAIQKYNSENGEKIWEWKNLLNFSETADIVVDLNNNVYCTGTYTVKLNSEGVEQWKVSSGIEMNPYVDHSFISTDALGNVYISGFGTDGVNGMALKTKKYDMNGIEQWVDVYNGTGSIDRDNMLIMGDDGAIYVTGSSEGLKADIVLLKYTVDGTREWERRYNHSSGSYDIPYQITAGSNGNIYISGVTSIPRRSADALTLCYDATGKLLWNVTQNFDNRGALVVDNFGGIYLTWYNTTVKYIEPLIGGWQSQYGGLQSLNNISLVALPPSQRTAFAIPGGDVYAGWAVGAKGTVLRTTNSGTTWVPQTVPSKTPELVSVVAIDYLTCYAGGKTGTLLKTIDGGTTWFALKNGTLKWTKKDILSMQFFDTDTGVAYAKDGVLLTTSNGGNSWLVATIPMLKQITSIHFLNKTSAVAVGKKGLILATSDGGGTWHSVLDGEGVKWTTKNLLKVSFYDELYGCILDDKNNYLLTSDGGSTWKLYSSPKGSSFSSIKLIGQNIVASTGKKGSIAYLQPGGVIIDKTVNTKIDLTAISFVNNNEAWAVGKKGTILHSTPFSEIMNNNQISLDIRVPTSFALNQNFPNPFNPTTTFSFELPVQSLVNLKVYNLLGQEVAVLRDNLMLDAGQHETRFDSKNLATGIYFYRLTAQSNEQSFVNVKKMMLIK